MRGWLIALGCGLAATAFPLQAASHDVVVAGIPQPGHIDISGHDLVLNGAGLRRFLFVRIYTAALYLPERQHDPRVVLDEDVPHSLQLTLLRDLSTEQNLDALKGGLVANNTPEALAAIRPEVDGFLGAIRGLHEVNRGTRIRLDYVPGDGTLVSVDNRHVGFIHGAAFNRALMKIWLGDAPVQASLKQALLGVN